MLSDWARFAGFAAFLIFALVGSILWALNYPPQHTEWTCKSQNNASNPNENPSGVFSCKPKQPKELQEPAKNRDESSQKNTTDDIKITDKLLALFTLFLVIVGATQAYWLWGTVKATRVAADATRDAVNLAKDTAERQLRAYVGVTGAIKTKRPDAPDGPGFSVAVSLKNSGHTPAYEFTQWATVDVRKYPLQKPFPIYCRNFSNRAVLGPESETLAFPGFKRNLTPLEEQAIIESGKAIYVYGEIDYRDAFGKQRHTAFRLQCSGQGYSLGLFKADSEGNEAD